MHCGFSYSLHAGKMRAVKVRSAQHGKNVLRLCPLRLFVSAAQPLDINLLGEDSRDVAMSSVQPNCKLGEGLCLVKFSRDSL